MQDHDGGTGNQAVQELQKRIREFVSRTLAQDEDAPKELAAAVVEQLGPQIDTLIAAVQDVAVPQIEITDETARAIARAVSENLDAAWSTSAPSLRGAGGKKHSPTVRLKKASGRTTLELILGVAVLFLLVIIGVMFFSSGSASTTTNTTENTSEAGDNATDASQVEKSAEATALEANWSDLLSKLPVTDGVFQAETDEAFCGKTPAKPSTCRSFADAQTAWMALDDTMAAATFDLVERSINSKRPCAPVLAGTGDRSTRLAAIRACLIKPA